MINANSTSQSFARRPQALAGSMCCFGVPAPWPVTSAPWAPWMTAMYELAHRQAVKAAESSRFFRRLEPSLN